MSQPTTVSVNRLAGLLDGPGAELIDVRTPAEFREVHAAGARNIPLDALDPQAVMSQRNGKNGPLYLICRSGNRAASACRKSSRCATSMAAALAAAPRSCVVVTSSSAALSSAANCTRLAPSSP